MKETTEFSFILKPSDHGVGVFTVHDISKESHLRVFGDEKIFEHRYRILPSSEVPKLFREYCMERGENVIAPPDFGVMPIGWYMNHSSNPNAIRGISDNPDRKYQWYAARDIKAGEEILIDYNSLEEPEEAKEDYYRSE